MTVLKSGRHRMAFEEIENLIILPILPDYGLIMIEC